MTLDMSDLRGTIQRLEDDVARLRRIADASEHEQSPSGSSDWPGVELPPGILVPRPSQVAAYLRAHPDLAPIVAEMAAALLHEFTGEPHRIVLDVAEDDYVREHELVFCVRVPTYGETFMDRLDRVLERFDDRLMRASGWLVATTDHVSTE